MTATGPAVPPGWGHIDGAIGPEVAQEAAARSGVIPAMFTDAVGMGRLTAIHYGDGPGPQKWKTPSQIGSLESSVVGDQITNEILPGRPRLHTWDGEGGWQP